MKQVILITGASSGFGALAARALGRAGHIVYASMRDTQGRNAPQVKAVEDYSTANRVDIRANELDVASQRSADEAVKRIVAENGRLDVSDSQRWTHGVRSCGSVPAGATCGAVRRECR